MMLANQRGMVLLLVLVVVALLSALLSEFVFSTMIDLRLTETFRDSTRSEYLARGGLTAGRMILQIDTNQYDAPNDPLEYWAMGVQEYPLADGVVSINLEDLDGRLQLNKLVDNQGNPNIVYRNRFERLCTELALENPAELTAALIDWLDPDTEAQAGGAEDAFYLSRQPAYEATDGPLRSSDELGLVKGFDAATLEQLRPFVSVYGEGILNVNTARAELLRSWDEEAPAMVETLIERRNLGPYKTLNELRDTLGVTNYTALNRNLDLGVKSSYYLINSSGRVNRGTRRMQAIVRKNGDQLLWQKVN